MQNLKQISKKLRIELLEAHNKHKLPHIGSELSCLDIMISLYFEVMGKEDKFILSKGHAAPALYAVLHEKGLMNDKEYFSYCTDGSLLSEHPPAHYKNILAATGSLGHGLSIAVGVALAMRIDKKEGRVFVLLSDGETEEGSTLEAMHSAVRFGLDNLVAIIDYNKWQAFDRTDDIQPIEKTKKEFQIAGWASETVDGHSYKELAKNLRRKKGSPLVIVADTVLGKGVVSLEDKLLAHYKPPTDEQVKEGSS